MTFRFQYLIIQKENHFCFLLQLCSQNSICIYSLTLLPPANWVCEGYVFTRVCLSTGGEYLGRYPPPAGTPPRQVHSPWAAYTSLGRYSPPGQVPPPFGQVPPLPGNSACWEIRARSERYASYWNASFIQFYFSTPWYCNHFFLQNSTPIARDSIVEFYFTSILWHCRSNCHLKLIRRIVVREWNLSVELRVDRLLSLDSHDTRVRRLVQQR